MKQKIKMIKIYIIAIMYISKMKVLITGIAGALGHHICEDFLKNTDFMIYGIDKLTYASKGLNRVRDISTFSEERVHVFTFDLCNSLTEGLIFELGNIDYIIHCAAETHVDNSIRDPVHCIKNNVESTLHILEYARKLPKLKKFIYFSSDEVYGSCDNGIPFKECDAKNPSSPYSASKSCGEEIALAYRTTYNIPLIIINAMNIFGERQHVEKFIPKIIKKILEDKMIDVHVNEQGIPGRRSYIHARNVSNAVRFIMENGIIGERYNIVGEKEVDNLEMVKFIGQVMGKEYRYQLIQPTDIRPGNDERYLLDGTKLSELGWKVPIDFENSLRKTIEWTMKRPEWLIF